VAKAHADVVLIAAIAAALGISVEFLQSMLASRGMGLAETQQVLLLNDLRSRIRVQTDGKLSDWTRRGHCRFAGAEEFGFATTS